MDTVSKLSRYAEKIGSDIRILGEPKTIDNDLVNTDHTPGFGSAARYVASTVREITLDACVYEKKSVNIIEIMGRHAGWLTGAAALARKYVGDNPLLIYLDVYKRQAAYSAILLVACPAASCDVSTYDTLDRQHVQFTAHHGFSFEFLLLEKLRHILGRCV